MRKRKSLNKKDVSDLRNQCKMGLGVSLLVFMLSSIIGITIYEMVFDVDANALNVKIDVLILVGAFVLSIVLNLLMSNKYYRDLRTGEKVLVEKTLTTKCKDKDYVAVRGGNMSRAFSYRFEFVVDNIKFQVDEELFKSCSEGDKLIFNYAPKSMYLLAIEKGI